MDPKATRSYPVVGGEGETLGFWIPLGFLIRFRLGHTHIFLGRFHDVSRANYPLDPHL